MEARRDDTKTVSFTAIFPRCNLHGGSRFFLLEETMFREMLGDQSKGLTDEAAYKLWAEYFPGLDRRGGREKGGRRFARMLMLSRNFCHILRLHERKKTISVSLQGVKGLTAEEQQQSVELQQHVSRHLRESPRPVETLGEQLRTMNPCAPSHRPCTYTLPALCELIQKEFGRETPPASSDEWLYATFNGRHIVGIDTGELNLLMACVMEIIFDRESKKPTGLEYHWERVTGGSYFQSAGLNDAAVGWEDAVSSETAAEVHMCTQQLAQLRLVQQQDIVNFHRHDEIKTAEEALHAAQHRHAAVLQKEATPTQRGILFIRKQKFFSAVERSILRWCGIMGKKKKEEEEEEEERNARPLLILGEGGWLPGGGRTRSACAASLSRWLSSRFVTVSVDEYNTSQKCPILSCLGQLQQKEAESTRSKFCTQCGRCFNKDQSASFLIGMLGISHLMKAGANLRYGRHPSLLRPRLHT
jgi:hypothetical protein